MTLKLTRYMRWWVGKNKSTTMVVTGPLFAVVGPIGIVWSVINTDLKTLLMSVAILLIGLMNVFADAFWHRGKSKPW